MKTLVGTDWTGWQGDALLVPVFEDDPLTSGFAAELNEIAGRLISELFESGEWEAKKGTYLAVTSPPALQARRLILLGAGPQAEYKPAVLRWIVLNSVYRLRLGTLRTLGIVERAEAVSDASAQAGVEGAILGSFRPDTYKSEKKIRIRLEEVTYFMSGGEKRENLEAAARRGRILAESTNTARALVNEPGNRVGPARLAEAAKEISESVGMQCQILGEPELEELGMNALLGVARGSDEPARLIVLQYAGADLDSPACVLVGKGVTFDSGGLSLKPADAMEEMKADKAGACAVLGAMEAIARLQLRRNVVAIIPAVENMPSGRSQRPGDVVRTMSGKTVEVLNTDAEGRLILADALTYAERFRPQCVIDLATLTGACIVALGHLRAGLFSNHDLLCEQLILASDKAGERLWRMPLDDEYGRSLDSTIADLKNVGPRAGGAITAAKFLQEFAGKFAWGHLDIAGVDLFKDSPEGPQGATGFGVRTLAEFVSALGDDSLTQ